MLNGVSLEARRGEIVALVGPSGGGKTTILNLIPRFYDVTGGDVTIDGLDVRDVDAGLAARPDRPGHPGAVPVRRHHPRQHRLRPARRHRGRDRGRRARRRPRTSSSWPCRRATTPPVGEAGARLSGGQRQRIAIARAFLKNAPILLLDEATSALDTESEAQVQAALERLMAGRTTILIAHRLSTVRGADRIYVIDRGRVVETGDHASLVARARPLRPPRRRAEPRSPRAGGGRVKRFFRPAWVQSTLAWLVSVYLGFTLATMRWRFENRGRPTPPSASPEGGIACFWHGRIALARRLPPSAEAQAATRADLASRPTANSSPRPSTGWAFRPSAARRPWTPAARAAHGAFLRGGAVHRRRRRGGRSPRTGRADRPR